MGRGGEVSGVSRSYEAAQKAHRESWKQMEERGRKTEVEREREREAQRQRERQ